VVCVDLRSQRTTPQGTLPEDGNVMPKHIVSYLLVIYYQNVKSYGAGMLTVLSNRIGDVALLIVIA
jgi:hypothetical protein